MTFLTDEQTNADLAIINTVSNQSVASLFKPVTIGGHALLMQLFNHPVADVEVLRNRIATIEYLHHHEVNLNVNKEEIDFIEHYLNQGKGPVKASLLRAVKNSFINYLSPSNQYYVINRGVILLIKLINDIASVCYKLEDTTRPTLLDSIDKALKTIQSLSISLDLRKLHGKEKPSTIELEKCDSLFRYKAHQDIRNLLNTVYELDVFTAVAHTSALLHFSYPQFVNGPGPLLELKGLFHPLITTPVSNDIIFTENNHLCFITGANMAGKSTLLKSVGISVLLAHVGFPVPASSMKLSLFQGLFTTINLSDNISVGHSHFYAEVLRIKEMALNIGKLGNVVIIFDELFRGTNVKDAHDASLAIIKALAQVKGCVFRYFDPYS